MKFREITGYYLLNSRHDPLSFFKFPFSKNRDDTAVNVPIQFSAGMKRVNSIKKMEISLLLDRLYHIHFQKAFDTDSK